MLMVGMIRNGFGETFVEIKGALLDCLLWPCVENKLFPCLPEIDGFPDPCVSVW